MIVKIFAIFDCKTQSYSQPFFAQNGAIAGRIMEQTLKNPDTNVALYPADHTLFEIGEYDDAAGTVTPAAANTNLGNLLQFVKQAE